MVLKGKLGRNGVHKHSQMVKQSGWFLKKENEVLRLRTACTNGWKKIYLKGWKYVPSGARLEAQSDYIGKVGWEQLESYLQVRGRGVARDDLHLWSSHCTQFEGCVGTGVGGKAKRRFQWLLVLGDLRATVKTRRKRQNPNKQKYPEFLFQSLAQHFILGIACVQKNNLKFSKFYQLKAKIIFTSTLWTDIKLFYQIIMCKRIKPFNLKELTM